MDQEHREWFDTYAGYNFSKLMEIGSHGPFPWLNPTFNAISNLYLMLVKTLTHSPFSSIDVQNKMSVLES